MPQAPDRAPDFEDLFSAPALRGDLWVDHYLPHWTTPDRSQARYEMVQPSGVRSRIDQDQLDWREEDAPLRVSNLQTASFSGPLGSDRGIHRHRPDGLTVRTETGQRLLWAPASGRVDITISASIDPGCMIAAWLVGIENLSPNDSGEICIFEIDAGAVGDDLSRARCGLKAHGDSRLATDMVEVSIPVDAARPHTWSVVWGPAGTLIGCNGAVVKRSPAAPDYPMALLIDLFELGPRSTDPRDYPKSAIIHSVRGWDGPA